MCFDEIYNFCLKNFSKFSIFLEINVKEHDLLLSFQYHFRYQPIKICRYTQFQGNRKVELKIFKLNIKLNFENKQFVENIENII